MAQPDLHPRRHVFHGHASGVSAHIRRPEKQLLPVQGSSSLPVTGGLSESNVPAGSLDKWVSFDSVTTSAHGDYVDAEQGVATTLGTVAFDAAPTVTRVRAAVRGLVILGRVHVAHAAMGLTSHSRSGPRAAGDPPGRQRSGRRPHRRFPPRDHACRRLLSRVRYQGQTRQAPRSGPVSTPKRACSCRRQAELAKATVFPRPTVR